MAALTTDASIKGNGLRFDVRSYKLYRPLDFKLVGLGSSAYYEIGDLPEGFIPRNIAILELTAAASAVTCAIYAKSDSAKLVERTLGTAAGMTCAAVQTVTSSAISAARAGETLCVKLGAASPASGRVKVVVSGDYMTDVWDEGDKTETITPASVVQTNMIG